ncbi:MAG: PilZ domain-containing protein [Desulfuromonadales bacterium]|nr:MAG: PilZ domain-containing protein [Desulfuromonadales bacterium]
MEERKCRRTPVKVGCWLVEMDGVSCVYTFDISDDGVSVVTEDPMPVGQIVPLQFFTPHSASAVTIQAEVVWSRLEPEGAMGLKFIGLDDARREILASFTAQLRASLKSTLP